MNDTTKQTFRNTVTDAITYLGNAISYMRGYPDILTNATKLGKHKQSISKLIYAGMVVNINNSTLINRNFNAKGNLTIALYELDKAIDKLDDIRLNYTEYLSEQEDSMLLDAMIDVMESRRQLSMAVVN